MDMQTDKIELAKRILDTNNPEIIKSIKRIFKGEVISDIWDELTRDQQQEIKKAASEIERGEGIDYETLMARHR